MQLPAITTFSELINKHHQLIIEYLRIENRILRSKLGERRLRFTDEERITLAKAAQPLDRKTLDRIVSIVKPDTILKWFREFVRKKWDMSGRRKKKPGRPSTQKEIRNLVLNMATDNNWGYKKIQGELAQFGIEPKYLIHDRDSLFKHHFSPRLKTLGIKPKVTSVKSPNLNSHCERMIRSIKEECLDHLIISGIDRLQYVLNSYRKYFNRERPHQGLDQRTPEQILKNVELPKGRPKRIFKIETVSHLGGLLKSYRWKNVA